MKRETLIWTVVLAIGALMLVGRAAFTERGMARAYVKAEPQAVDAEHPDGRWMQYENATYVEYLEAERANPGQSEYSFSLSRTAGTWIAALFTLFIMSFLYRDNPFYKVAESVVVGVSAAYWMVIGFWTTIVPNLVGKLSPGLVRGWSLPGMSENARAEMWYLIPLALGVMLLWRLAPKGAWISRWPMAFVIGTYCGLRLISFLHADFLSQIRNGIVPLAVMDGGGFDVWKSLENVILTLGVFTCLVYFFFSIEHKGAVGKTARVGIWFLMITFGAAFGYTVMGRIALLAIRFEFLFDDWLWLIDPGMRHSM